MYHEPLPEWPSQVVSIEPQLHVVIFSHNKLAFTHHYQLVSAPSLPPGRPLQCKQTKPHPPRAWT